MGRLFLGAVLAVKLPLVKPLKTTPLSLSAWPKAVRFSILRSNRTSSSDSSFSNSFSAKPSVTGGSRSVLPGPSGPPRGGSCASTRVTTPALGADGIAMGFTAGNISGVPDWPMASKPFNQSAVRFIIVSQHPCRVVDHSRVFVCPMGRVIVRTRHILRHKRCIVVVLIPQKLSNLRDSKFSFLGMAT